MLPDSQRVGHDRERRVDRSAGDEETTIDDVQVVEVVRFTILIEGARFGIVAETHGSDLVRDASERNPLADKKIAREEAFMALVPMHFAFGLLLYQFLKLGDEPFVTFLVIGLVTEHDAAFGIDGHSV